MVPPSARTGTAKVKAATANERRAAAPREEQTCMATSLEREGDEDVERGELGAGGGVRVGRDDRLDRAADAAPAAELVGRAAGHLDGAVDGELHVGAYQDGDAGTDVRPVGADSAVRRVEDDVLHADGGHEPGVEDVGELRP